MKNKLSPTLAGSFVLAALALIVTALLTLRSCNVFSRPGHFIAYFNESVQGLDVGSAVKLRGVPLGRVKSIQVHYDANTRQSQVAVVAELNQNRVADQTGQWIKLTDPAALQRLIDQGLRAKIDLVGITGLQFVELDFFDPQKFPAPPGASAAEYPVVPTLRSGLSELVDNLSLIAGNLDKVDFAGLSRELKSLLATVNQQASSFDLKKMVASVTSAASSIDALASSAEAKAAFANLNKTATDVQALVAKLDTQVQPVSAELVRSLRSFNDAAQSVKKLVGPQSGLSDEAVKTLRQLTQTAESLQALADFLERNPNALITGKKLPDQQP
jgi:paraquat-inducible protein B